MSGRIWVVEINAGTRNKPLWAPYQYRKSREYARIAKGAYVGPFAVRIAQYVRQGGAR